MPVEYSSRPVADPNPGKDRGRLRGMILFCLWPSLAFVKAIVNYRRPWAKNIVWMFVAYYGFTFVLSEGGDANRYRDVFLWIGRSSLSLSSLGGLLYNHETRFIDIAQPLISFIVSRVTDDYRILLAVFGLIFGYFYSRNIWYLLELSGPNLRRCCIPLILTFAVLIGFWRINNSRFWTAAHIFIFGALPYLIEKKKNRLWACGLSTLFHFSFVLPVAVFVAFFILGNRKHLFFYFFIASFFIYEIDLQIIRDAMRFFPSLMQERTASYVSYEYATALAQRLASRSWHAQYYQASLKLAVVVLGVITYFDVKALRVADDWRTRLFSFAMLFYAFFNVLANIPSFWRFTTLSSMFMVSLYALHFQFDKRARRNNLIALFVLPAILFYCVVAIRIGCEYAGIYTIFGNPFTAIYGPGTLSLMDLLK